MNLGWYKTQEKGHGFIELLYVHKGRWTKGQTVSPVFAASRFTFESYEKDKVTFSVCQNPCIYWRVLYFTTIHTANLAIAVVILVRAADWYSRSRLYLGFCRMSISYSLFYLYMQPKLWTWCCHFTPCLLQLPFFWS